MHGTECQSAEDSQTLSRLSQLTVSPSPGLSGYPTFQPPLPQLKIPDFAGAGCGQALHKQQLSFTALSLTACKPLCFTMNPHDRFLVVTEPRPVFMEWHCHADSLQCPVDLVAVCQKGKRIIGSL